MSPRVRIIAVASLLVVFFGLGAGWLFARAASTGSSDQGISTTSATGTPTVDPTTPGTSEPGTSEPPASGGGGENPGGGAAGGGGSSGGGGNSGGGGGENPGGVSPGGGNSGGGNPPRPSRSVRVAGAALDGNQDGTCATLFINDLEVTAHVEGIALSVDPGSGSVVQDDANGCADSAGLPLCADGSLTPDSSSCLVGVSLEGSPPDTYTVGVSLDLRVSCTSPEPVPCNQIESPVPTSDEPVDATWSDSGPSLEITVDDPDPDPDPDQNTNPDSGDTDGTGETGETGDTGDTGDEGGAEGTGGQGDNSESNADAPANSGEGAPENPDDGSSP
jgi:hypothetical protein